MIREDQEFLDDLTEAIRQSADMTWEEFITPLTEEGIFDKDGNLLVCMPPTPKTVYDEDGNPRIILPDLSQPPHDWPPGPGGPTKAKARLKARPRADAKTKPKARKKPGLG